MHSIRSQARRAAWQYKDGDVRNYNPFARMASGQKRPDDEELQRTYTEGSVPTRQETERRADRENFNHPPHHNTAPDFSSPTDRPRSAPNSHNGESSSESVRNSEKKDFAKKSTDAANGTPITNGISGSTSQSEKDHGAQKRKGKGIFAKFHKNKDADDNELSTTESGKSAKKRKHRHFTIWEQLKATVFGSWVNVLLIAVPVGFALRYAHANGTVIFVVNFIAIVPLAAMLSYATEELALYVGETMGGLLNATFGNATELIVGVIALQQKKIVIVQTSLIGSMLSNLLLVLGMCFFFGGINRVKQHFNVTVAQTAASLLALSIGSLIIPTAFDKFGSTVSDADANSRDNAISRGTSIILLAVYGSYLLFQLKTHNGMYNEPSKKVEKKKRGKKHKGEFTKGIVAMGAGGAASAGGQVNQSSLMQEPEEEPESPNLSVWGALITLGAATVLIAFCSEFMVTGIDALTAGGKVSQEFVGLILLPIVGNAAEHATAVTVAIKDKMDLAIGVAVGSSMQIALLVLPLMVIISWCGLGAPDTMTLVFDGFQVAVLFIAVLLVNYLIQDGESHWLEGVLLQATYLIIAVSAWFYIDPNATAE